LKASGRTRSWRTAAVGGIFAYSLLYAATVDALMLGDSRYRVAHWMRTHIGPGDLVGISGPHEIQPALDCRCADIGTLAYLAQEKPRYYILSADYAHAVPLDTPWGQLIAG